MSPWLIGLLVFLGLGALASLLYRVSPRFRRQLQEVKGKEKKRNYVMDVLFAALGKHIWEWRDAPKGSLHRLGWDLFVAAILAYLLWGLIRFVDRRLNGPDTEQMRTHGSGLGEWAGQDS